MELGKTYYKTWEDGTRTSITKTKEYTPAGAYTDTKIDVDKKISDFLLISTSPYHIKWANGKTEKVNKRQLNKLQNIHTWKTDF